MSIIRGNTDTRSVKFSFCQGCGRRGVQRGASQKGPRESARTSRLLVLISSALLFSHLHGER